MSKSCRPRRRVISRLAVCAGVLLTAAAVAVPVMAPAADAVSSSARSGDTVAVRGRMASDPVVQLSFKTRSPSATIRCEMVFIGLNGGVPHHSGHVPGTINVRVRVTCSKLVVSIKGRVGLTSDNGVKIRLYGSEGKRTARGNAALVCHPGYYVGVSSAKITAPPGYSPPTATLTDQTAEVHIKKC